MQSESASNVSSQAEPPRPHIDEKRAYLPGCRQEEFIVPLLRNRIEECLENYGKPASNESKMLDVGCGRHPFRERIQSLGYTYHSCDVNQNSDGTVEFLFAIDSPMPPELAAAGPFDLLLCTEVLEHVADWDVAFGNMANLLSDAGALIITAPHFYQLHEAPYDFWRPTPHAIEFYSRRHGLKIVHSEAAGDAWDVLGTVLANCWPVAISRGLLDRAVARLARTVQRALFSLLVKRRIQARLGMGGPLYISNIAVCRKAAASER